jgi:hypothetical protein
MSRWFWAILCILSGLAALSCGLLIPAHIRAVDREVLWKAGEKTPTVVDAGFELLREQKVGPAKLLLAVAQQRKVPGREKLQKAISLAEVAHPEMKLWGSLEPGFTALFGPDTQVASPGQQHFTEFAIQEVNREKILKFLASSPKPLVQELMRTRALTNTVLFSPSSSVSGQAFDAGIGVCGLLLEREQLSRGLSAAVYTLALQANNGVGAQKLEQILLDLLSLGQRFQWAQLVAFVRQVENPETLRELTNLARNEERRLPVLFSAVLISGNPAETSSYVMKFGRSGMGDLAATLGYGSGAVKELLRRQQQITESWVGRFVGLDLAWRMPWLAMALKWLLILAGGFLLAMAAHLGRPAVSALEQPLQVRGFHLAREFLFGLGFLLAVLLLTEPFLSQESQKIEFPFRIHLPTTGGGVNAASANVKSNIMNQLSLLTLLLFFVLQGLIYIACLLKLGEIRRQQIPARMKLKLLDNEDHLFDAGLYLGFVGTIISLILVSLGVIKPSLMAAYSSTSFGIIFVSAFKIFNLRPVRRKLLLEAESRRERANEALMTTEAASMP